MANHQNILRLGQRYYLSGQSKETVAAIKYRVHFSFYIRTEIFRKIVSSYLEKIAQDLPRSPEPVAPLCPYPYEETIATGDQKGISIEGEGIYMSKEMIDQFSAREVGKIVGETNKILSEIGMVMD